MTATKEEINRLREIIDESESIVFFGGAGVSTESGLPDFRSENGLYNAKLNYGWTPEEMLSHSFFMEHTDTFYDYLKNHVLYQGEKKPNKAHYALAKLEEEGKLLAIVTQNVDNLHQMAGSKKVYELHGSGGIYNCMDCGKSYDINYICNEANCDGWTPHCADCGGVLKPNIVLYEEALPVEAIDKAVDAISKADCLIIGGTSLAVYPAASYVNYFKGKHMVIINKSPTQKKLSDADLEINAPIGETLGAAMEM